jgi:general stress protein 26
MTPGSNPFAHATPTPMSQNQPEEHREHLRDLIRDFDTAMLTSHSLGGHIRSRPMHVAEFEEGGSLWFVSDEQSGKVDELTRDGRVAVVMQGGRRYVSISGTARVVDDRARLSALWKKTWNAWFPDGPTSPGVRLIEVRPEVAEYWDASGTAGLKYALGAVKAMMSGERVDSDATEHGRMHM